MEDLNWTPMPETEALWEVPKPLVKPVERMRIYTV